MSDKSLRAVLMPHREVKLECGVTATVYPAGLIQIQEFSEHFATIASMIGTVLPKKDGVEEDPKIKAARNAAVVSRALPYLITNGLELISKCVTFDLDEVEFKDLPHWDVAEIVSVWIDLTIGDDGKKLNPWVTLMSKIGAKMEMLSPSSTSSSSS